ncbi:MAG: N-acetylglucosamine kinase [Gemmatimonadaceae bacterium]
MTELVAGVDGGGSKTRVIVGNASGEIIGETTGAGSATAPGRTDESSKIIADLVRQAVADSGMGDARPASVVCGVSGAGRPNIQRAMVAALEDLEVADEVSVVGDGEIAFYDAFDRGPGVLLVSGTGSIAHGRGPSGQEARCGGWGIFVGDEGSGRWIGRRALAVVAAASDGREPPTELTGAILTAAQVNEPADLIPWAIAATGRELAALAPVVLNTAANGDARANAIVSMAVEELVLHVRTLATSLFGDERAHIPVAVAGGLMLKGSLLRKRLEQRLKSAAPGAQVKSGDIVPARGAMKWAYDSRVTAQT